MVSERSITSKLIRECKPYKTKNENNLVEAEMSLFITNSTICNLSDQSSY